jgi:hypothetical protein
VKHQSQIISGVPKFTINKVGYIEFGFTIKNFRKKNRFGDLKNPVTGR